MNQAKDLIRNELKRLALWGKDMYYWWVYVILLLKKSKRVQILRRIQISKK
jgi:hypothetical protein